MTKVIEYSIRLETLLNLPLMNSVGLLLNQTERIKSISDRLDVNPYTVYREVISNGLRMKRIMLYPLDFHKIPLFFSSS